MSWTSDHKNQQKKNDGSGITPSYFPALMNMVNFGHFHNTEPRDRTDKNPAFYFVGFMVYQLSDAKNDIYNPFYL